MRRPTDVAARGPVIASPVEGDRGQPATPKRLRPSKGVLIGLLLSLVLWAGIILAFWWRR